MASVARRARRVSFAGMVAAAFAALACAASAPARLGAQPATGALRDSGTVGVLLVAHGADAGWNSRVDSLAAALRKSGRTGGLPSPSVSHGPCGRHNPVSGRSSTRSRKLGRAAW